MSLDEEDDFWNSSDVKAFSFDDEDQIVGPSLHQTPTLGNESRAQVNLQQSEIKTLGSVLAARPSSNEPFLKPSMIKCDGSRIEDLITYIDNNLLTRFDQRTKQDPKGHIRDIIERKAPLDFSRFKAKRDKLLLLDCAICSSDGNTITAASIFLSKTLKRSIFIEEMKKRPTAIEHYVNYLEITGRAREASSMMWD